MTERTVFECDGCSETLGYRNGLTEVPLVYESDTWEEPTTETCHLCVDCGGVDVDDVLGVYDAFLCDSPNGEVVELRRKAETTVLDNADPETQYVRVEDLHPDTHGNVAIIEDAIETVNGHLLGGEP